MDSQVSVEMKKELIKKQPLFSQLTNSETEELASLFTEVHASPDDVIVKEGDLVDSVFLIVKGKSDVRHVFINPETKQHEFTSLAVLAEGQAIGLNETGFYSISGRRTATVVAVTDMVLLRLSVAEFNGFSLSHTHVGEVMRRNTGTMSLKEEG